MSQSLKASGVELDFRPGHNLRRNLPMADGAKYNHGNLDGAVLENVNFKSNDSQEDIEANFSAILQLEQTLRFLKNTATFGRRRWSQAETRPPAKSDTFGRRRWSQAGTRPPPKSDANDQIENAVISVLFRFNQKHNGKNFFNDF